MFRHVAVFRFRPEVTQAEVAELTARLGRLPEEIDVIRRYRFGPDANLVEGTADYAVVADFDDADAYLEYRHHPAHQEVLTSVLTPMLEARMAAQIVSDD